MPVERLRTLEADIMAGACTSLADINQRLAAIAALYDQDEWEYVSAAFAEDNGFAPDKMTREQAEAVLTAYDAAATALHAKILDDSKKEFDAFAKIGFGLGMTDAERDAEFATVRGSASTNAVVQKLVKEQAAMAERSQRLKQLLAGL
jgi:hypothetical protein